MLSLDNIEWNEMEQKIKNDASASFPATRTDALRALAEGKK